MQGSYPKIKRSEFDAVLFDMDGVLTDTAILHAIAWKQTFDKFLQKTSIQKREAFKAFDSGNDYLQYVDGKARNHGVVSFLKSRNIELPLGLESDEPGSATVWGIGREKNQRMLDILTTKGINAFVGSVEFIKQVIAMGFRTAVVSSSVNCEAVLEGARIAEFFEERVDGNEAKNLGLASKPAPDTYKEAAKRLGVQPKRTIVIEDAIPGVQSAKKGRFGLIIGVARSGDGQDLVENGADFVVSDLGELIPLVEV